MKKKIPSSQSVDQFALGVDGGCEQEERENCFEKAMLHGFRMEDSFPSEKRSFPLRKRARRESKSLWSCLAAATSQP
jgi:hypothetical protein